MITQSLTVAIEWMRPEQEMPAVDLAVLVCAPSAAVDVFLGHYDSEGWRDERGMKLHSRVVAWAYLPTCPRAGGAAVDLPAGVSPAGFVERAGPGAFLQSDSPIGTSLAPRPAQSDVCPYCVLEGSWNRPQESGALAADVRAGLRRVMTCARHS